MENPQPRPITDLKPANYDNAVDLRGTPTHVCICGCEVWNVKCVFHNYEMSYHYLDMECANCGSLATAPTPSDMPEGYIPEDDGCAHEDTCDECGDEIGDDTE